MPNPDAASRTLLERPWLRWAGGLALAVWIFGLAGFYYLRLSFLIYFEHQESLQRLLAPFTR